MLKVVIIDDEPLVLEGLRTMVDWSSHGYKIVGEAINGEEGFDLIAQSNPDLVITDMRMPVMDGLSLIEKCRQELESHCKFVILSGYSDFDYVKKALELKSYQYLLKPIDSDEIHKMLLEVAERLESERSKEEKTLGDLEFIVESSMKRVLLGETKAALLNRIHFILKTDRDTSFALAYLHIYDVGNRLIKQTDARSLRSKDELIMLGKEQIKNIHEHKINRNYQIIDVNRNGLTFMTYGLKDEIKGYLKSIQELFEAENSATVTTSLLISSKGLQLNHISGLVEEVNAMKKMLFYGPQHHVYRAMDAKEYRPINELYMDGQIKAFYGAFCKKDDELIKSMIDDISHEFRQYNVEPELVRAWISTMFKRLKVQELISIEGKEWLQKQLDLLNQFSILSLNELKVWTKELIITMEKYIVLPKKDDPIEAIKDYVKENYDKDIKIKHIGLQFGFNSVYIGQLFQKQEGLKYNDYLMTVRMEKGIELLKYTDFKIKEIAVMVGYKNPDYFVLKFKEIYKVSPIEYRKANR